MIIPCEFVFSIISRACSLCYSEEFKVLFSRYGKVDHSVILAVLDNYSRRRGFVVFSTHAEAKNAMRAVHKMTIKCVLSYSVGLHSNGVHPEATSSTSPGRSSNVPRAFSTGVPTSRTPNRRK